MVLLDIQFDMGLLKMSSMTIENQNLLHSPEFRKLPDPNKSKGKLQPGCLLGGQSLGIRGCQKLLDIYRRNTWFPGGENRHGKWWNAEIWSAPPRHFRMRTLHKHSSRMQYNLQNLLHTTATSTSRKLQSIHMTPFWLEMSCESSPFRLEWYCDHLCLYCGNSSMWLNAATLTIKVLQHSTQGNWHDQ